MSAPMVTGAIPLILQAYQDNYLTQYGYQLDDHRPVAALAKAILVNSADDMRGPQGARDELINSSGTSGQVGLATIGPDYFTGFGRLNVEESVLLTQQNRSNEDGILRPTGFAQGSINDGGVQDYQFSISQDWINSRPAATTLNNSNQDIEHALKITLAWDDPASSTLGISTNKQLINDLDLELIDPTGTVAEEPAVDCLVFGALRPVVLRDAGLQHLVSMVSGHEPGRSVV